jgi:hypothetical protein
LSILDGLVSSMLPTKIVPKAFVLLSLLLGAVGNVPSSLFLEKVVATITLKNDSHIYAKINSNGKGQNDTYFVWVSHDQKHQLEICCIEQSLGISS